MPHVYAAVDSLEEKPLVGSHQCVALIQRYAGAPHTSHWRAGERVSDNGLIAPGTAIATFVDGRYRSHAHGNHAAFFVRREANCIWVMDQWSGDPLKPRVSSRRICAKGKHSDGSYVDPSNNAEAFSIIEW